MDDEHVRQLLDQLRDLAYALFPNGKDDGRLLFVQNTAFLLEKFGRGDVAEHALLLFDGTSPPQADAGLSPSGACSITGVDNVGQEE